MSDSDQLIDRANEAVEENLSPEELSALDHAVRQEQRLTAFGGAPSPEEAGMRALIGQCKLSNIIGFAVSGQSASGPEAELQQELGLQGNHVPFAMLINDRAEGMRAAATLAAPNDAEASNQIWGPVFASPALNFLGIRVARVNAGAQVQSTVTAPDTGPADVAAAANVGDTAMTFTTVELKPKRIQMSISVNREDRARIAGLEGAAATVLRNAAQDGLEVMALTRASTGLLTKTPADDHSTEDDFASYRKAIYDNVDGRYASKTSDVRLLVGAATLAHMSAEYRSTNAGNESADESIMRITNNGLMVSAHVPASASDVQQALIARMREPGGATLITWEGIELLADPFSLSADGQIRLTAILLADFRVNRGAQYKRIGFKLA